MITGRTLGPVELMVDGAPAPAEMLWRKNLALLVYLARSPRRTRTRQHLMGLLWPDKPEPSARHSLREAVRVVRRCVGEEGVETSGDQIRLAGATELDVERLEELHGAGDWAAAASLVAGEFLEGFGVPEASGFEEWLAAERLAWRRRSVEVLVRQAECLLAMGDAARASELASRALGLDPLAEPAVQSAMKSLAISGDRAGALERYESHARRLKELGSIEPGAPLRVLADRVRQGRTWQIPAYLGAGRVEGAESRRAPLVGRGAEFKQVVDAWVAARDGHKAGVGVVLGDPGVGKTRLMEELLVRARLEGAFVAAMVVVPADRGEAWSGVYGLARALGDAAGLAGAQPPALAAFASQLPGWADRFGTQVRGVAPYTPGRALSEVVAAVCDAQPVVLALDDAHWLDDESLGALTSTLRDRASSPLFVVVGMSPQSDRPQLDALRTRIGRDLPGVTVPLSGLPETALKDLATWAFPRYTDAELDRVTRRVLVDSAGLPLLAVELLHAVAVGLDLAGTDAAWPRPFKTLDQTLPNDLPDAVLAAIRVGFRRLSKDAQHTLAALAVLGDRVETALVGRAAGLSGEALSGALDELEWQRWLMSDSRGYGFVARIVKDTVARDMLTPAQRQRVMERLG
ncbi:MAG TPA: AAA family ATPase [Gemmatimonadales bacterium]